MIIFVAANFAVKKTTNMKHYRFEILGILFLLILAEIIWSWRKDKKVYEVKEKAANIAILIGFHFSKFVFAGYQLTVLGLSADVELVHLPNPAWVFVLCFF